MKLSVIIPVYNVENYLAGCLDSLLSQGLAIDDYEMIIVNDGSKDSSLLIAERYKSENENIRIISQENQGISIARNAGLEVAKGDYVYFIDPDDFLLKNSLSYILNLAYKYKADMVTFKSTTVKEDVNDKSNDETCDFKNCTIQCTSGLEADKRSLFPLVLSAWFYLVRRSFLLQTDLRFIPEMKNSEDTPFTLSVMLNARTVVITDANIHRYLERPDSIRKDRSKEKSFKMIEYDIKATHHLNLINQRWRIARSEAGYKRTQSMMYIMILFAILRMLRINVPTKYIKQKIDLLKKNDLYVLGEITPEFGYGGLKFNFLKWFCNHKWLVVLASCLLFVKKRYEGCSL